MPFLTTQRLISRLFPDPARLPEAGARQVPEVVTLPVAAGVAPSARPPVRIFLGTEPGQYRAERIFLYSIEKVRDPSRVYEIHLMKDVAGFDRRWWLTGFTNYRFAIAHWAGKRGRAIYNDVDQVYLSDPAELFDSDMGGKGFLALTENDTAVMLIDCEKMGELWPLELCQSTHRKQIEKKSRHEWGKLDPAWHARDFDYVPGYSKVLHFTTIHEQPWHPCPELYVYMPSPVTDLWMGLEREADAAGYSVFDFHRPSLLYRRLIDMLRQARALEQPDLESAPVELTGLTDLLARTGTQKVLDFSLAHPRDTGMQSRLGIFPGASTVAFDPTATDATGIVAPAGPFDAVVCTSGLDLLHDEDVPWVLDELARRARRLLYIVVEDTARKVHFPHDRARLIAPRGFAWWRSQLEAAARKRPDLHWRLGVQTAPRQVAWREGGRRIEPTPPRVWILSDPKPGHTTQSIGLTEELGWPVEVLDLGYPLYTKITDRLLAPTTIDPGGRRRKLLQPPWPDLVVSTGWTTGPIARWIAAQSDGRVRTVQMGRKGGDVATNFDLVVTCSHVRYPPHERRIQIVAPINQVTPRRLADAAARFPDLFGWAPHPRIVVLVGGSCAQYTLDVETARALGRDAADAARACGGSVFVVTSRRTGDAAVAAIEAAVAGVGQVHRWSAERKDNPYLAYLAGADALIVTGESESMIAEACASGKPVFLYPVPKKKRGPWLAFVDWITAQAFSRPRKSKGTIRPQQGLEYFCARLIERGLIHPTRDLEAFHRALVDGGYARMLALPLDLAAPARLMETQAVADRVRALLGCSEVPQPEPRREGSRASLAAG
ncbi:MAG TPA: ELM1/GtrOC1 family putative glycosyltransferase [Candidatus Limnocylindrales bacterium]|nr:ELM1/GtrOC1 family putative glycosyltransferase [Candidatus Limnocylindrales bacterium]